MDFRILGPLEVRNGGGAPVALGGSKPRAVLAVLLLHANESVSPERLACALWGADAPPRAIKTIQVYVSRIRKALHDADVVETTPAGYRLRVRSDELDAARFEHLVEEGRSALSSGQHEFAAATLREALALWEGPPLGDLASVPFAAAEIARLEEERLAALELRVDADLAAGQHTSLVGELQGLVATHPTRERFAAQLMLALYRCGRQPEALESYRGARSVLVGEFGIEPSQELSELHDAILRQDAELARAPRTASRSLPRELEVDGAPPLVGRDSELASLRDRWGAARDGAGTALALTGGPGMGKTRLVAELAVDAHRAGCAVLHAHGDAPARARTAIGLARVATQPTLLVIEAIEQATDGVVSELERLTDVIVDLPVMLVTCGDDDATPDRLGVDDVIELGPLDADAAHGIAASYVPRSEDDAPARRLAEASGGVPARVHELGSQWERRHAARRVGDAARRAAASHEQARAIAAELTTDVVALQAVSAKAAAADDGRPLVCPFKGLSTYEVADAPYFAGRERLIAEVVARLVGAPLLGLVGPSGSGKSSVLRAGLLPALSSGMLPGSEAWRQVLIRPGEHPLNELRDALAGVDDGERVVIAVDQFEETFTVCADAGERAAFIAELLRAGSPAGDDAVVVLALRADFYGRCAEHPELSRQLAANHVLVGPMQQGELRRAIEQPAELGGVSVAPDLVEALLRDVAGQPAALPLLSTVLLELWQRRDGRHMRRVAYEELGGVRGAVARLAEDAFALLDPGQQTTARRVLIRLAAMGEDGAIERRRVPLAEIASHDEDVARVVAALTDRRLLSLGSGTIELAHEALLREWPRLARWIEEDRDGIRLQRRLHEAAQEWDDLDRDDGALYRGTRLDEAIEWRASRNPALNELEQRFLTASEVRRRQEQLTRSRRTRIAFGALVVALVGVGTCAIVAMRERDSADRQREAAASRELATRSATLRAADPGLSLGLALQALGRSDTEQARNAVRQATHDDRGTGAWRGHDGWLYAAAPSADGKVVATAGQNGTVRIWSLGSGRVVATIRGHADDVYDVAISPDRRLVASASMDGSVVVSDLRGGQRRRLLSVKRGWVSSVQFSPDGRRVLASVSDGTLRIVPVSADGRAVRLHGHRGWVFAARFDRSGHRVVSGGDDRTARIWDLARGSARSLRHPSAVQTATFSPDGRRVATGTADGIVRVWSTGGHGAPRLVRADRESVYSVRFSADGRRLLTAGEEGVVRVWDVRGMHLISELKGHRGRVLQANFLPGDAAAVSVGEDGMLRRWALPDAAVMYGAVNGARYSPDGRFVVSGGRDGAVRLFDVRTGAARELARHAKDSVARFSADGQRVVSASLDGTVQISDVRDGTSRRVAAGSWEKFAVALDDAHGRIALGGPRPNTVVQQLDGTRRTTLRGHTARVYDMAFSPDGRLLASASEDGTVRVWDARTGAHRRTLRGHLGRVNSVAFSSDARRIVSAGADGTVRVWSVDGGGAVAMRGHDGVVRSAAFDRDGARVVSTGADGTVRVWDAAGETLAVVHRHAKGASGADFSPDGRHVVSAGDDDILWVSPCDVCGPFGEALRLARSRSDRELSAAERARYLTRGA